MELLYFVRTYFWLILFFLWGFPLFRYRSEFRQKVYRTDDWKINIQPRFWKEWQGLLGNLYPEDEDYLRLRNFYRFYLLVYLGLFIAWKWNS
ncbi:MAG: hypothetical protein AAFW73_13335 [Bacteroidota bacterium]